MPTEYFESKVRRAVDLDEFSAAVVPKNTSPKAMKVLENAGIEVQTYTNE